MQITYSTLSKNALYTLVHHWIVEQSTQGLHGEWQEQIHTVPKCNAAIRLEEHELVSEMRWNNMEIVNETN